MSPTWPVIILGGSGYVAGEMLRLVDQHPRLWLGASVSSSLAGEPIADTFAHLKPAFPDTRFVSMQAITGRLSESEHWVVLSAAPHAASAALVGQLLAEADTVGATLTIVDASADFRFKQADGFSAIYGQEHAAPALLPKFTCAVPEHLSTITTPHAAHPGCFATTMLLGIVPLLKAGLCEPHVRVSAVTGSTGAGRSPRETTHHPVRQSNLFAYQALTHRHTPEVHALTKAATGTDLKLDFVPHSGPFARGIHATIFASLTRATDSEEVTATLADFYGDSPFVAVSDAPPRMKDIAGSNYAVLNAIVHDDTVVICSVLDNLLKGAAGGSMQWVNRLLGLPEAMGLDTASAGWL